MGATKILIEVQGGVVENIVANDELSIYLVDHDALSEGDLQSIEDAKQAMQPYQICDDDLFKEQLKNALADYE
jgi:hypothetical protein